MSKGCQGRGPSARPMVSVLLALSFLILATSGVLMLFWSPGPGVGVLGLDRRQWSELHRVLGAVVVVAALAHVYLNWRALLGYVRGPARSRLAPSWATVLAVAVMMIVVAGTVLRLPPFSLIAEERHGPPPFAGMGGPGGGGPPWVGDDD